MGNACDKSVTDGTVDGTDGIAGASGLLVRDPETAEDAGLFRWAGLASTLVAGAAYKLCLDTDGGDGLLAFGDTGFEIFILGFDAGYPLTVEAAAAQVLSFVCTGCGAHTTAGLAEECPVYDGSASAGSSSAAVGVTGLASNYFFSSDATNLTRGRHYRLCLSIGSGVYMETGQAVYVTGITDASTVNVLAASSESATVHCAQGCSASTSMYLGLSCDHTDDGSNGLHAGVPGLSAPAALLSQSSPGTFYAVFDASQLNPGLHQVCASLGPGMFTGDTGVQINVQLPR